ncbi:uncharacterized protein MAM_02672 [Metarhizium album ARSEF 1941]|uniref:Uncharacterized protein n=1 Tax=Metarhizium album (strain ARSEF 1941) TaxID=1081103 RepID=A0A0B2X345_METAS|nr:uncharacterized protein MAM_02672 [Metarhizium album ARSEF 1941]KHN99819.1 hypothetical protein MAM_02672 [Metarhizium album ARSEF 1941]
MSSEKPMVKPQAINEKIAQRHAVGLSPCKKVKHGDCVTPHHSVVRYDTRRRLDRCQEAYGIGVLEAHYDGQVVLSLNRNLSNESESNFQNTVFLKSLPTGMASSFLGKDKQRAMGESFRKDLHLGKYANPTVFAAVAIIVVDQTCFLDALDELNNAVESVSAGFPGQGSGGGDLCDDENINIDGI